MAHCLRGDPTYMQAITFSRPNHTRDQQLYKTKPHLRTIGLHCSDVQKCCYHWKNWTSSTVKEFYFQDISRVFLEYFHTTENISILWNGIKLWKLDFPTFFYNIFKILPYYGRGPSVFTLSNSLWNVWLNLSSRKTATNWIWRSLFSFDLSSPVGLYDLSFTVNNIYFIPTLIFTIYKLQS